MISVLPGWQMPPGWFTIPIMEPYRVLIVAGDPLARAGLAALLGSQPGCIVAGQMAAEDDVSAALDVYRPDVLLWDLGWDPDPVPLADAIDGAPPVVTLLPDADAATGVWAAGARGLLLRSASAGHLLAEGLSNRAIAHRLDISEHTVKFHLNAILSKLHAQSRTEAVVHAIRLGLITV